MRTRQQVHPGIDGQQGFSLLEIVVALFVLGITSAGLFYIGTMSTAGNTRSKDHAAAVSLATEKLEELRHLGFRGLTAGPLESDPPLDAEGLPADGGIFSRSWQVEDAVLNGNPAKKISVEASWAGGGVVSLSTPVVEVPRDGSGRPYAFLDSWTQKR